MKTAPRIRIRTNVRAGGTEQQHNQSIWIRNGVTAGKQTRLEYAATTGGSTRSLRVRTDFHAGVKDAVNSTEFEDGWSRSV